MSAAIGRPVPGTAVVYPPVDVRRFAALRGALRERRTATVARFAPEKNLGGAVRIMREAGGRYDIVGNARGPAQLRTLKEARRSLTAGMRLHANAGHGVLEEIVGGARAYLHASEETFGVSVAEAAAAGCVPVVPDHTAHPETVPFAELRYRTEAEAAEIVRGALDGRYDGLLPALQEHVRRFSEEAFQEAMLGIIEGGEARRAEREEGRGGERARLCHTAARLPPFPSPLPTPPPAARRLRRRGRGPPSLRRAGAGKDIDPDNTTFCFAAKTQQKSSRICLLSGCTRCRTTLRARTTGVRPPGRPRVAAKNHFKNRDSYPANQPPASARGKRIGDGSVAEF